MSDVAMDVPYRPAALDRAEQGLLGKPVLKAIPGQVASPLAPPPGCAFAPRCESAKSGCDEQMPQLVATGPARLTRCLQYVEGAVA